MTRPVKWRPLLTKALPVVVLACAFVSVAAAKSQPKHADVDGGAEAIFRDARGYTVRIRTRIETPFAEDTRGSFEGAGFLVDAERGWILTNAHVVGQSPSQVEVAFAGEDFQPARKVYVDSFTDVAVLSIPVAKTRRAAVIDPSGNVRIGEAVGAFGHPLGMHFTGTRGIVSNTTDHFGPDLIQIDATVDHGNSGGPVISLRDGRVVGIATAGAGGDKSDRLNFATPIRDVDRILSLLRNGIAPMPPRLEIGLLRNDEGSHTMTVARSFDEQRWPLLHGDRILEVEGAGKVSTLTDLVSALRGRTGPIGLQVERAGTRSRVVVSPALRAANLTRRGVELDGALIGPIRFDDEWLLREPIRLLVMSIAPGSAAEARGLEAGDYLQAVDGRRFEDVDSLFAYAHDKHAAVEVVVLRWAPGWLRLYDHHVRELPGESARIVTDETSTPELAGR